jgi:hypothetical protein
VLEVGRVERAGRPDDDRRLLFALGRGDLAQRVGQQRRVVVDRPHAVGVEQPRQQAQHRDAVLEHVGDPARGAHVVLEHLPGAVGVAHQVAAGDVAVDAARRPDAVRLAREGGPRDDQLPRHDAVVDDLAPVVDVVDEAVERADPLGQSALDLGPLGGGDDARDEVERERAVAHRPVEVRTAGVERDPLLHEDRVAAAAGVGELVAAELGQRAGQRLGVGAGAARRGEDLVVEGHPRPAPVRRFRRWRRARGCLGRRGRSRSR